MGAPGAVLSFGDTWLCPFLFFLLFSRLPRRAASTSCAPQVIFFGGEGAWGTPPASEPLILVPPPPPVLGLLPVGCRMGEKPCAPLHGSPQVSGGALTLEEGRGGWNPSNESPPLFFLAGGNAGMAAAYAARKLGLPATVVVPSSTGPGTVRRLQELGATVEVCGKVGCPPPKLGLGGGPQCLWMSTDPKNAPSCVGFWVSPR